MPRKRGCFVLHVYISRACSLTTKNPDILKSTLKSHCGRNTMNTQEEDRLLKKALNVANLTNTPRGTRALFRRAFVRLYDDIGNGIGENMHRQWRKSGRLALPEEMVSYCRHITGQVVYSAPSRTYTLQTTTWTERTPQ
jgi:hypothetical protein